MSVLFSWLLWNYQIVLTVFSEEPVYTKINLIKPSINVSNAYLIPLGIAILYILVHSLLTLGVEYIIQGREWVQLRIKNWAEGKTHMTPEDQKEFLDKYADRQEQYESRIATLIYRNTEQDNVLKKVGKDLSDFHIVKAELNANLKTANETIETQKALIHQLEQKSGDNSTSPTKERVNIQKKMLQVLLTYRDKFKKVMPADKYRAVFFEMDDQEFSNLTNLLISREYIKFNISNGGDVYKITTKGINQLKQY